MTKGNGKVLSLPIKPADPTNYICEVKYAHLPLLRRGFVTV